MAAEEQKQTGGFFNQPSSQPSIDDPFAADEIVFRDETGTLKVLQAGAVKDLEGTGPKLSPPPPPSQSLNKPAAMPPQKTDVAAPFGKPLDINTETDSVIAQAALKLNEDSQRRFRNIIMSRLRDIRDSVQTKEALLNPEVAGGLGLDAAAADRVLQILEKEVSDMHGRLRENVSTTPFADLHAEATQILAGQPTELPEIVFKMPEPRSPVPPSPPAATVIETVAPKVTPPPPPVVERPRERPKIEDVKFEPRLTGPLEEIRSMTLIDFRRLAATPQLAADKIMEKINLLEEESFTQRVQAIKAWQKSEVNRLYLALGDQSMEERKSIADVIAERKQAQMPTLTVDELEAIMELNKRLRY